MSDYLNRVDKNERDKDLLGLEKLSQNKVFIATPCYGGNVTQEYVQGLLSWLLSSMQTGVSSSIHFSAHESLIPRGRNHLVAEFMTTDCTHLLWIDADIKFKGQDIIRLLRADRQVVSAAYPIKSVPTNYVVNYPSKMEGNSSTKIVELKDAGTGFMLVKREVFEIMMEAHPELHYTRDFENGTLSTMPNKDLLNELKKNLFSLYDTMHDEEDENNYLSEDYTFCRRWQKLGGKVWLDTTIELGHIGRFIFPGNVSALIDWDSGKFLGEKNLMENAPQQKQWNNELPTEGQ